MNTNLHRPASPHGRNGTRAANSGTNVLRGLLWLVLAVSVVCNTVASFTGAGIDIHLASGGVTTLCVAALVVLRLRNR
ncbi:hypothetical protein [Streptomyces sp. NPDC026659]|uniref:hypothetical protein n=1 Tax=Streptomyces sp. NPDC026659 TaxID=3155123 RepID=UPI00340811A0